MPQPNTPPTKIMIIRHAEKPLLTQTPQVNGVNVNGDIDQDSLIVQGWQRAGALAVLFAPTRGPLQDPNLATPNFIYACSASNSDEANRPQETVTPLISKLTTPGGTLMTNMEFEKDNVVGVATSALSCWGVVLISWPHGQIPNLANQIPLSPASPPVPQGKWPSNRFDVVWVFDYDSSTGKYTFSQVPQLLLAGDSPEPLSLLAEDSSPSNTGGSSEPNT